MVESVISLYSKENSIDDNNVNSVKFMEFSEFDNNSFDELDLMSTIPAENLINNPDLMSGKLNEIAKNNGTVNVNARMAVIKENNKASAALVRTDGVLVTKEVPVYPANYIGNGYHMDIKNLGIEYALLPADSYSGLGLQGNIIQKYSNENKKFSYPEKVELPNKVENKRIEVPYPHQFNDAIIVFPRNSNLPPLYAYSGFPAIELKDKDPRPQQEQEFNEIKDSVKFTISFYEKATQEFGKKAAQLSRELAEQSKGKTIRNVEDALRTYEKYGQNINNKINAKDRAAIIKALESIDAKQLASNLGKFSKGLGYTNHAINAVELLVEFKNAVKTGNWRPFFVKAASITAGLASVALTAFAFSLIIGGPVGILGYALIIATVGALIDDALVEKVSGAIGI
ncbi:colicin-like pore-forming protein [Proteus vulgaris]|uniref:colicin-like pore-forming protein n=1 Tax=Proteus vulgaris TaxID=585 RepID=UPI0034DCEE4F